MKKYNDQGVRLIDDQLLVLCDKVDDIVQEKDLGGGKTLYMAKSLDRDEAEKAKRQEEASQTRAVIVDISTDAYLDLPNETKPETGERIFMQRHAGEFFKGVDGVEYRIIREGDIHCFINF